MRKKGLGKSETLTNETLTAEEIAEILLQIPLESRKVIVNQMKAAIITYQAMEPYLKDELISRNKQALEA